MGYYYRGREGIQPTQTKGKIMKHIAGETGSEYISRMTREGKTLGERGRMPWSHVAGLVTADDLRDAVNRGWVRVENVPWRDGKTIKHLVACKVVA